MRVFENDTDKRLAEQRAVAIILMAAVFSGGAISQAKIRSLSRICSYSPLFAGNSKEETSEITNFAICVIPRIGWNAIEQATEILSQELRETAFAFAHEVLLAEDLNDSNEHFICRLLETLQIREDIAMDILRVSIIRARGL